MFTGSAAAAGRVSAVTLLLILTGCTQAPQTPLGTSTPLSVSPAGDFVYACVAARGWDVELEWDGSIVANSEKIPKEQIDLYSSDVAECTDMATEKFAVPQAQLPGLYEAELKTLDCLHRNGISTKSEPPSQQVFIDSYDREPWTAYSEIDTASMTEKDWKALNAACPQPLVSFDGSFD